MGNRATVIFWNGEKKASKREISPAVYLHWNGGPESIYAFLRELDRRGVRADQDYECARFVQLVGEFFTWLDGRDLTNAESYVRESAYGLSLGVVNGPLTDDPKHLNKVRTDHGDNGFYLVNRRLVAWGDPATDDWRREDRHPDILPGTADARFMRRFDERYFRKGREYRLVEWSREQVQDERTEADASDYRPDIRQFFLDLEVRAPKPKEQVLA